MRVLDVGSGAGDVALLVAELIGPTGQIVGVDRSRSALAVARARANEWALNNLTFHEGDLSVMSFEQPFDAIVGRYVLMFQAEPTSVPRKLKSLLRADGMIMFHEVDYAGVRSFPPVPIYDRCCAWVIEEEGKRGADMHMGIKLYATFLAAGPGAGFPPPEQPMRCASFGTLEKEDLLFGSKCSNRSNCSRGTCRNTVFETRALPSGIATALAVQRQLS